MEVKVVIGLGFGDEGKGKVVDFLTGSDKEVVVRFNGGHQAGHTVYRNNFHHVFSTFGSGTLKGVPTYITDYCTINPVALVNEYNVLKVHLKEEDIKLYVDPRVPLTTPMDVKATQMGLYFKNGSVGVGFGATLEREENYYSLMMKDVFYKKIFDTKFEIIRKMYGEKGVEVTDEDVEEFKRCVDFIRSRNNLTNIVKPGDLYKFSEYDLIFEGAQGLMLDQNFGFFPYVTRSNTGIKNINEILFGMGVTSDVEIYYVTRAYSTRHGKGPLFNTSPGLSNGFKLKSVEHETNAENDMQGAFRTTYLDVELLRYALDMNRLNYLNKHYKEYLVVNCMDQLSEYKFTNGYDDGYEFPDGDSFIDMLSELLNIPRAYTFKAYGADNLIKR